MRSQSMLVLGSENMYDTLPPSFSAAPTPIHTPVDTPQVTPTPTPAVSPERGATAKKKQEKEPKKKQKKERNPDLVILAPNNMNYSDASREEIYQEMRAGKHLKYIYQNKHYKIEEVRTMLRDREIDVSTDMIFYIDINKFRKITNGICMRLDGDRK